MCCEVLVSLISGFNGVDSRYRPNSRVNIWTFRLPRSDGACNLKKDGVLTICCGLHGCDIYLRSGNTGKQLSLKTLAFECNSIEYDI